MRRRKMIRSTLGAMLATAALVAVYLFPTKALQFWALWYVAITTTAFVVTYHVLQRWWETPFGRNIMTLMSALAGLADAALVNNLLGRPDWMRVVFLALYVTIGTAALWRLFLLVESYRAQRPTPPTQRD